MLKANPGDLATGLWTQVELSSLVARKVRMGELPEAKADEVRRQFERVLGESFELFTPTAEDFATAARYLAVPKTGLRAGDALHLAIAANNGATRILTLDQGFLAAGRMLRLPVARGIKG